jgi:cell division protein FtsQ
MDRARRFFKKINTPRLALPRRGAFDTTISSKILTILEDNGQRISSFIDSTRIKTKRFIRVQLKANWKSRVENLAIIITQWVAHPIVPKHFGVFFTAGLFATSLLSGVYYGNHVPQIKASMIDLRDDAANSIGYDIRTINIIGGTFIKEAEIREIMGMSPNKSLMFFDIEEAKAKLMQEPWIADVKLTKNLPHDLQIILTERKPVALWQYEGKVSVIAPDGKVLLHHIRPEFKNLPLLVGKSADVEAKSVTDALEIYPALKDNLRAAVLVSERSWRLILKNGLEIKLPEKNYSEALARLMQKEILLTRDLESIDLRLADRITLRLSDGATEQRAAYLKDRQPVKPKEKSL